MKSKTVLLISALFIVLLVSVREYRVAPDGNVHVHVLDVGQGDSIFIVGPAGQQIMVDGGPNLSALSEIGKQMSLFDRNIDLMVLTHPHLDHLYSLPEILRRYKVQTVLITGIAYSLGRYDEFLALLQAEGSSLVIADPARDIDMGNGLRLDVLWPPPIYFGKTMKGDMNDSSVVMKLIYGEDSMLLTGDMEEVEENAVRSSGANIDADILKVAHHGSRSSTSTGFLLAVSPDIAIISAGKENKFGHPHLSLLDRLRHFGIPVQITANEGSIELELDGRE